MYGLNRSECFQVANILHRLFNYRFNRHPGSLEKLSAAAGFDPVVLPGPMYEYLAGLLETIFTDPVLAKLLFRPHCLGNLLLAAAIWQYADELRQKVWTTEACYFSHSNDYEG